MTEKEYDSQINFKISKELRKEFRSVAINNDHLTSSLLRSFIEKYVADNKGE